MVNDDEFLERIVAGIHTATMQGADVAWNETINGRQFDVVARFTLGLLRYLVLIEVKNKSRKTSASDIEAFVQKSEDQNANKSVFVNVSGYQKGAEIVAQRHGVDIFTVKFDHSRPMLNPNAKLIALRTGRSAGSAAVPAFVEIGGVTLANSIEEVTIYYDDGRSILLPTEPSQLEYYAHKTKFLDGHDLIEPILKQLTTTLALDQARVVEASVVPPQKIIPPDDYFFPPGRISRVVGRVRGVEARIIGGNTKIESTSFSSLLKYTNILTGEEISFPFYSLPIGETKLQVGKYYFITHPLIYYYCESIEGFNVTWILVESFQNGNLIRATVKQNIKYASDYILVTDRKIIARLERRLRDYRELCERDRRKE